MEPINDTNCEWLDGIKKRNQAERIKSYDDYYLITDRKQDSNSIHLICKDKLEYVDSYSNKNVKYILVIYKKNCIYR